VIGRRRDPLAALLCALLLACGGSALGAVPPGEQIYNANCALCHQQSAEGLPGQFPRLKGRIGPMLAQLESRRYAIEVVLNGMAGSIDLEGTRIVGVMPPLRTLSDRDIASVLAYVAGLNAVHYAKPVSVAEVAEVRAAGPLTATEMRTKREQMHRAGLLR